MCDHQHASTSFGMRTSRSSSARLSCASVVVCLAPVPVNCRFKPVRVRPGPGERRLEMEFAPPEKARMQKAISVHQTCSLYPYTEMARARETNSTTSLPRGGTTTPLGASCAHSSALLSPSTACERRARPRTHGELRTSGRCGEHLHARRLRKSRSEGRGRRAFGISSCRPSIPPSWARAAATYSGGRRGWGR